MTPSRWFVAAVFFGILVTRAADAQVLTGSLSGTVKDESGGVLPVRPFA
jgi:hypothetical protein